MYDDEKKRLDQDPPPYYPQQPGFIDPGFQPPNPYAMPPTTQVTVPVHPNMVQQKPAGFTIVKYVLLVVNIAAIVGIILLGAILCGLSSFLTDERIAEIEDKSMLAFARVLKENLVAILVGFLVLTIVQIAITRGLYKENYCVAVFCAVFSIICCIYSVGNLFAGSKRFGDVIVEILFTWLYIKYAMLIQEAKRMGPAYLYTVSNA